MEKKALSGPRTLRVRLLAIVALCWLLPTLALGVYMSSVFFDALRTKTQQALVAGASHAEDLTIKEIERILKKSRDVTYDGQILEYYISYHEGEMRYEDFYIRCRTYWLKMFQRERMMSFTALILVDEPDIMTHTATNVNDVHAFKNVVLPYILEIGETLDTRSHFAFVDGKLFHVRNLYRLNNRQFERFGMLVLGLEPDMLLSPLLNEDMLWEGSADIILDEYVHIANPDYPFSLEAYRPGLYQEDGDLYYSQQVKTNDYTLTYRIRLDKAIVFGQINEYYQLIVILLLLLLPLEALIMLFIHRSLTRPLMRLAQAAQRMAGGELGITVPTQGKDEIGQVAMVFNGMSVQLEHLVEKSYKEELALRDARIAALQSRINPHFMNNALELMNWQARLEGAETVSQMIEAMSTLINAALDRTNEHTVPLQAEIEVADAYFFFIKQRFGDRVSIEKQLDASLQKVPVPHLSVQTLLENAVEHGINPAGGGVIRLEVYAQEGMLYIDVRNNGKTLTDADQENIRRLLEEDHTPSGHLGIRNINLRLKLIYDNAAGLTLTRDEAGETLARISIPLRQPEQPETTNDIKNQ